MIRLTSTEKVLYGTRLTLMAATIALVATALGVTRSQMLVKRLYNLEHRIEVLQARLESHDHGGRSQKTAVIQDRDGFVGTPSDWDMRPASCDLPPNAAELLIDLLTRLEARGVKPQP